MVVAGLSALAYWFYGDKLDRQIDAKVAQLGVKPASAEPLFQKALRVRAAIAAGDFATAQRVAIGVLAQSRIENWRFYPFDDFIKTVLVVTPPGFGSRLNAWVAGNQTAAMPLLFRAQYELNTGWTTRGEGYANAVGKLRMQAFAADMQAGLNDVVEAISRDAQNPFAYYLRLRILGGAGLTPAFGPAFHDAIARYPAYYRPYEMALQVLQPQWGGSVSAMAAFVDRYAGNAPRFSPLKLLYLSFYRYLLNTAAVQCDRAGRDRDQTAACISGFMEAAVPPDLVRNTVAALQLYDHTDKYQFGVKVMPDVSAMLGTSGGDAYSGTVLQFLASAMHSDTQLMEAHPGHNDYVVDEMTAYSWWWKSNLDNARTKYTEALADMKNTKFPSVEERDAEAAEIYEQLADLAYQQNQYVDEIAYEKAAVMLGLTRDEHYICAAFYHLKRYDHAIRACTDAIKSTGNSFAYYWRGEAYKDSGRSDQALADLGRNADLHDGVSSDSVIEMSMIYFNRHDARGALRVLNEYQFLYDPARTDKADVAVAYNNRCYAYMLLGELKKALADCTESLKYGNLPDALSKEQELLVRLGGHKQASKSP